MSKNQGFHHEPVVARSAMKSSSDRSFGFVFSAIAAIMFLIGVIKGRPPRYILLVISFCLFTFAVVRPGLLAFPNRLWSRLGLFLHRLTNPVVLGILFFLVITPIGLILRVIGKDLLRLKFDSKADSYWIKTSEIRSSVDDQMKFQF